MNFYNKKKDHGFLFTKSDSHSFNRVLSFKKLKFNFILTTPKKVTVDYTEQISRGKRDGSEVESCFSR